MNKIALFCDEKNLYWHGIIIAAAIAISCAAAVLLRRRQKKSLQGMLLMLPLSILLGVLFSRLVFWNYQQGMFDSFFSAFTLKSLAQGGYALVGGFIGVLLSGVLISCIMKLGKGGFMELLDAAAVAGSLGISLGRLSALFSGDDLGQIVMSEGLHFFPVCIYDAGQSAWRLAVFAWESAAAFIIFLILLRFFDNVYVNSEGARITLASGDVFLLFLLYYGCSQCMLESFRSDSLFFNILGLVRVSQVGALIMLFAALLIFCIRLSDGGIKLWHAAVWVLILGLLATAFVMELILSSNVLVLNYSIMGGCLLAVAVCGTWLCSHSRSQQKIN